MCLLCCLSIFSGDVLALCFGETAVGISCWIPACGGTDAAAFWANPKVTLSGLSDQDSPQLCKKMGSTVARAIKLA